MVEWLAYSCLVPLLRIVECFYGDFYDLTISSYFYIFPVRMNETFYFYLQFFLTFLYIRILLFTHHTWFSFIYIHTKVYALFMFHTFKYFIISFLNFLELYIFKLIFKLLLLYFTFTHSFIHGA